MKTKHILLTGIIALSIGGMVITGCKKTSTNPDTDSQAAQDDANATFAMQDSKNIADGAAKGQATERPELGPCSTIYKTDSLIGGIMDTVITVNFGTSDCVCLDGRKRRGEIIFYWNGKGYFDSASSVTMTFKNYYVNDIGVTGTRTLTNIGKDMYGDHSWYFTANLTLTYPTGGTATWTSTRTNTLIKSSTVSNFYYYSITGSANGTSRSGVTYTITISSPLIYAANWINSFLYSRTPCYCIEAGQLTITRSGKSYPLYLTYTSGLGNCSYTATATINGNSFPITLL